VRALLGEVFAGLVEEPTQDRADDERDEDDVARPLQLEARVQEIVLEASLVLDRRGLCGGRHVIL
jgi:hypothetical protein